MRALISVSDKRNLVEFAHGLAELGAELYSTGGTQEALSAVGLPVRSVSDLTGFPEILGGRVKTLHPAIHGGILAKRDHPNHRKDLADHQIKTIELVVVNLYPFVETVSRSGVKLAEALENIDIGGPTLIRAAAKNHPFVTVVVDPDDYGSVLEALREGQPSEGLRRRLAQKAFQHVAAYDPAIAGYLRDGDEWPERLTISLRKAYDLRYGENPHQRAAFYHRERIPAGPWGIAQAEQLHGKELSYNNLLDADGAWAAACDFAAPAVAIVKHTNPCGLAIHEDQAEAYRRAFAGDPVSAFGGIVAVNRTLELATAEAMAPTFFEIVIAPDYSPEALERLRRKRDLRILKLPLLESDDEWELRAVRGGLLLQTGDRVPEEDVPMEVVTERAPDEEQRRDLAFAWRVVKHIKSNGIVLARDRALLGMGAGQPNRLESVELALLKAAARAEGSVLASDAFFPFPDGVEAAARGGVTAVIQRGSSSIQNETIEAADRLGLAMVFTGRRHFRH